MINHLRKNHLMRPRRRRKYILAGLLSVAGILLLGDLAPRAVLAENPTPGEGEGLGYSPERISPAIEGIGGIVQWEHAVEPPEEGSKVVFDLSGQASLDAPAEGIEAAVQFLNLSAAAGIDPEEMKVTLVLRGSAVKAALGNVTYSRLLGEPSNPNHEAIQKLIENKAEVFVCLQSLARHQYSVSDLVPGIRVAQSGSTVLINRQRDGYAILGFHP